VHYAIGKVIHDADRVTDGGTSGQPLPFEGRERACHTDRDGRHIRRNDEGLGAKIGVFTPVVTAPSSATGTDGPWRVTTPASECKASVRQTAATATVDGLLNMGAPSNSSTMLRSAPADSLPWIAAMCG
jgi:hypothetical protein